MKYTPTKNELDALRRLNRARLMKKRSESRRGYRREGTGRSKIWRPTLIHWVPGVVDAPTLGRLFRKSLVRWGGPMYFGCVFVSRRGERFV